MHVDTIPHPSSLRTRPAETQQAPPRDDDHPGTGRGHRVGPVLASFLAAVLAYLGCPLLGYLTHTDRLISWSALLLAVGVGIYLGTWWWPAMLAGPPVVLGALIALLSAVSSGEEAGWGILIGLVILIFGLGAFVVAGFGVAIGRWTHRGRYAPKPEDDARDDLLRTPRW